LELRTGGDAVYNRDHPLDADLVVVDEASMLDVLLADTLVKAIPPGVPLEAAVVGDQVEQARCSCHWQRRSVSRVPTQGLSVLSRGTLLAGTRLRLAVLMEVGSALHVAVRWTFMVRTGGNHGDEQ
jgi:hypothetical protein